MRDAVLRLFLSGILLLATELEPCHGICLVPNTVNGTGTVAQCSDLHDIKYFTHYKIETLKTSVTESHVDANLLRNLTDLVHLELTEGDLEHIERGTFRDLPGLRSLDLSQNKLRKLDRGAFDGLKNLRSLSLHGNEFNEIPTEVLSLKNLKAFDIAGNPLNCSCHTLKVRDELLDRRVYLSKRILCSSPPSLKSKPLINLDNQIVCSIENGKTRQMNERAVEAEDVTPEDLFDDPNPADHEEEEHDVSNDDTVTAAPPEVETPAPATVAQKDEPIAPLVESTTVASAATSVTEAIRERSTGSDEMFFSDDSDRHASTSPLPSSSSETAETTEEPDKKKELEPESLIPVEGSGEEDDLGVGSDIEGSGTGVPPIKWDVPDDETESSSASTTKDDGWFSLLWDTIAGTSAPPEDDTTKDLSLQDEEFISASTERSSPSSKAPVDEESIVPVIKGSVGSGVGGGSSGDSNVEVDRTLDDTKSGQVKAEPAGAAEATDAAPARQQQKGMGSYVVLAILLGILGALIGFAAYKGEFCKKKRKRGDAEGGTELKDMTKSLLEPGNGAQPKIASNGNLENVPLVNTPDNAKIHHHDPEAGYDASNTRYSAAQDAIDPVKPPRKSFATQEDPEKAMGNGRSHQDLVNSNAPEVCVRSKSPGDTTLNGNRPGSISSLGTDSSGMPRASRPDSIGRPPLSPGAQRVKITLQENPDSVPKTPILITRTKAGENLVKTP